MKIIGCDFHPSFQQIAMCDLETGEFQERKLSHADGQAERFYRELGEPALIGIEATGNSQWFVDLVQRLGHEIREGMRPKSAPAMCASKVRTSGTRGYILKLLLEKRFPQLWRPSAAMRDQRQLLRHRDKLVEVRTKVKNSLQHLAMKPGDAEEEPAVDTSGDGTVPTVGDAGLGGDATGRFVAAAQGVEPPDRALGSSGEAGRRATSAGPIADDPAWEVGRMYGAGFCADHRGCDALCR